MQYLIITALLFFTGNSEAAELWTKYDVPDSINCITSYGDNIWAGTNNGIVRINRSDGTIKKFTTDNGLPSNTVTSICSVNNGIIYVGLRDIEQNDDGDRNAYIVLIDGDEITYCSEVSGLRNPIFYPEDYSTTNEKLDFILSYNGNTYFGVNLGLWPGDNGYKYIISVLKFDGNNWSIQYINSVFWSMSSMKTLFIYNMYIDLFINNPTYPFTLVTDKSAGKLKNISYDKIGQWNTYFDSFHADYISNSDTTIYSPDNSVLTGYINTMAIDSNYTKWFGCSTLVSYNGIEWKSYTADSWEFNPQVKAITIDDDNCIWLSTKRLLGLYRFNPNAITSVETANHTPSTFTLSTAYPNPFNASTTISFTLNKPEKVNLAVYNLAGQKVRELAVGNYSAGSHTAVWDGRDDIGNPVSSGVYLARMESGGVSKVVRMAMVK